MADDNAQGAAREASELRMDVRIGNDVKWMIGMVVAAVIVSGIGVAAIVVAVVVPQFSRLESDMRHQEERVRSSNNDLLLELQVLFAGMRDDYRDRMHGVEDLERELQAIRQRLESREPGPALMPDIERALSDVEWTLSFLIHHRPLRGRYVAQRLDEAVTELKAIRQHLDGREESGASTAEDPPEQAPAPE